jgi:hypothetical protein
MRADAGRLWLSGPVVSILALGLFLALPGQWSGAELQAQSWSDFQASRAFQGQEELSVRVSYEAGQFTLGPASGNRLYQVRLRYDEEATSPIHDFGEGRLQVGVDRTTSPRRVTSPFSRRGNGEDRLELQLGRQVPISLDLELGAVRTEMELGGIPLTALNLATGASDSFLQVSESNPLEMDRVALQVGAAAFRAEGLGRLNARSIEVDAGVGDVRLDLTGLIQERSRIEVSMGLGSVRIAVPRDVGIRLTRSTFLTSVNASGLSQRDGAYFSENWESADRTVEIQVDAAFGSITIERTDP